MNRDEMYKINKEPFDETYKEAKTWFENATEADLDLLIGMGVTTKERIVEMYLEENE